MIRSVHYWSKIDHPGIARGAILAYCELTHWYRAMAKDGAVKVVLTMRQPHVRLALELVLCEEPGVIVVGMASETEGLLALTQTAHTFMALAFRTAIRDHVSTAVR